jgi:hypothetical protein
VQRQYAASALLAVAAWALPAAAQHAVGGGPAPLALPFYPTEAGKPVIYDPQFVAKSADDKAGDDKGCGPGLACRLRLLGVIQKNGAVELRATAFTW